MLVDSTSLQTMAISTLLARPTIGGTKREVGHGLLQLWVTNLDVNVIYGSPTVMLLSAMGRQP